MNKLNRGHHYILKLIEQQSASKKLLIFPIVFLQEAAVVAKLLNF
jgi:hypothetical protein